MGTAQRRTAANANGRQRHITRLLRLEYLLPD
jgi:hypothetical protein